MNTNSFYKANKKDIKEKLKKNNAFNKEGRVVISKDDEWRTEVEWDFLFDKLAKERGLDK